jgi:glutathione S-transferase
VNQSRSHSLEPMILRTSLTSPFGRKVRLAAHVLGVLDRFTIVHADTLDESDTLRQQNPLGKLPTLLLPDGRALYDSRTIVEFLHESVPDSPLFPADPVARAVARTQVVLCDGVTDAALLLVYEGRFRDPQTHSSRWTSHQAGKVWRSLDLLRAQLPPVHLRNAASISLVCALGYLDWRQPLAWRERYPEIVAWLERISALEPAISQTAVPL